MIPFWRVDGNADLFEGLTILSDLIDVHILKLINTLLIIFFSKLL